MPGFIKPQLATLKTKAPKGDRWLHEIKYDGYRIQIHLNRGKKKVFTRNGWTGPSASRRLLARWPFQAKPSSMGR
jgi:ATP-dependent DNA ligase